MFTNKNMECPSKIISIHCVIAATPYLNTGDKEQSLADSLKKSWTIVSLSTVDFGCKGQLFW